MSDIAPIGRSAAAATYTATRAATTSSTPPAPTRGSDRAEFSDAAQLLSRVPDVRQDLIDRVKGEIDKGTYETDEKIDKAIESLLEDIA
jgi:anti-sigma28 factor (negative regulator of flagellin synthesis)